MKKIFTLAALLILGNSAFSQCSDLFFSEYIEGSSSNKAAEIYNPTNATIDLTDYVIYRNNNGSFTPTDSLFPTGTLDPDSVWIFGNPSANPAIQAQSDTLHTMTFFNGDDAMWIKKISTGDTIDIIGEIGIDPGSGWVVGTGATNNFTLIRKIGIQQGQTDWSIGATEWDVFPIDMVDSLGTHNMTPCAAQNSNCPTDLFFSEYIEGSSSNKAAEIYNPTGATIDLTDYVIYRNNNGSFTPTDSLFPTGTLDPDSVWIFGNPSANPAIQAQSDTLHTMTFYNGDDAMWIKKISTGDTIDIIGEIGVDPGSGWAVGTGFTNNFTLIRKIGIQQGQTDWSIGATEWDVYPIDMIDSLGSHTMTPCGGTSCTPSSSSITAIACDSYLSPSGNYVWTVTNLYTDTVMNAQGCDSVITVDLTVNSTSYNTISPSVCDSYTSPSGNVWTISNTYTDTIPNASGCDSIITIMLTVNSTTYSSISPTVCDSYTSPSGNIWTVSNTYTDTIPNASGCDSIITIMLTVNSTTYSSISPTVCDSYTSPSGNVWTVSNTYTDTIPNASGCDSIITVMLTVNSSNTSTLTETACDSYTSPLGNVLTTSGTYTETLTNTAGCDSVITINLTINTADNGVSQSGNTLTADAVGASYQWLDCNNGNAPLSGETNQSFTATSNGSYAVEVTENGCTATSACTQITGIGISENNFASELLSYPNPTKGTLTLNFGTTQEKVNAIVRNAIGQETATLTTSNAATMQFEIEGKAGVYFIEVSNAKGERAILRVIKE